MMPFRHAGPAIFLTLFAAMSAAGYEEPPFSSYTRTSPNGEFVFVMLHRPLTGEQDTIAARYPASGLYRKDQPATPRWSYPDEYAREAYPASDGIHVVVQYLRLISPDPRTCGNSPPEPPDNPAVLGFYASGKKIRDVKLGELLDHVAFARHHGPGWHAWLASARIDDKAGVLVVETTSHTTRHLDLRTGLPVIPFADDDEAGNSDQQSRLPVLTVGVLLAFVTIAGTAAIVFFVLFRSRQP